MHGRWLYWSILAKSLGKNLTCPSLQQIIKPVSTTTFLAVTIQSGGELTNQIAGLYLECLTLQHQF